MALLVLLAGAPAHGQVLHERVTVGGLQCESGICRAQGSPQGTAKAIAQDGQVYYRPSGDAQAKPGEQIFTPQPDHPVEVGGTTGAPPPGGDGPPDRRDIIRTDRDTGPEGPGKHFYHVVFNPDPFPYKRMTALDAVEILPCTDGRLGPRPQDGVGRNDCDDEVLEVQDRTRYPLRVLGAASKSGDRDAFWGSIVIELEPGRWVPIPSVAPETRILEYSAAPEVPMEFAHDGGDNLYVRSSAGGRHRLTWLSDAPQRYFAGELPAGVRLSEIPRALQRVLPERLLKRTAKVLAHIGIKPPAKSATLESVLDPLVSYFRAFQVGELPPSSGSSYLDLAMAQKGCCRHRSYAFAITAMALGIPVRYVENEVHVFVEVYIPRAGWRRVNLGGAPINEEIVGGEGKSIYREKGGDPFPQPAPFLNSAAPPPKGLNQLADKGGKGGGSENGGGSAKGNGSASGNGSEDESGKGTSGGPARVDLSAVEGADAREEEARKPAARRARTHLTIALSDGNSFRGETVEVSGEVSADGADAGGLPIEIYLDRTGGAVKVAEAITDAGGKYRVTVEVPKDLPLGDHRVVARTRGDDKRAPSSTRRN